LHSLRFRIPAIFFLGVLVAGVVTALIAIRLFQDKSGWTPHYTESGVDQAFQPVCFGPSYVSPAAHM